MLNSNPTTKSLAIVLLALLTMVPCALAQEEPAQTDILDLVPANSIFCIRVNNFDKALGLVDEYIAGLSPIPMPLSMMARMPLAQLVSDPTLKNVNTAGNFAVFGIISSPPGDNQKPDDLFIGGLIPVTDYAKFVADNPNCAEPDKNGISKITPPAGQGGKVMLTKQLGDYCLIGPENAYRELRNVARTITPGNAKRKARSLGATMPAIEAKAAKEAPFWTCGNVQLAAKTFGPLLFAKIDEGKQHLKNMPQQPQGMSPDDMINMYVEMLKYALDQTDHLSLAITPSAQACTLSIDVTAVKDGDLAGMLVPSQVKAIALMPYLREDAMMNFATKINKPLAKGAYDRIYDLIGIIAKDGISADDMAKLRKLSEAELDSFGDSMAFSMSADPGSKPPFDMTYAAEMQDPAKYRKVLDDSMELISTGAIGDIYKSMGLKLDFQIKTAASQYKGVSIDSAKLTFKSTDPDSDMAKAINAMYGEGFDYRWAVIDNLGVYAIGSDVDKKIKDLIDQAKSPNAKPVAKKVREALATLPASRRADFVGTLNYVRAIEMGLGMAQNMDPKMAKLPKIDVPTESSLAFAGRIRNGAFRIDVSLPKKHLTEIIAAFKQIGENAKPAPTPAEDSSEQKKN